jgi:hypothetical protein
MNKFLSFLFGMRNKPEVVVQTPEKLVLPTAFAEAVGRIYYPKSFEDAAEIEANTPITVGANLCMLNLKLIENKTELVGGQSYLLFREQETGDLAACVSWWQKENDFFNGITGGFEDYMVFNLPTSLVELLTNLQ